MAGGWAVLGPEGQSVCEIQVPLAATPVKTVEALAVELRRLQTLAPMIDETIADCLAERTPETVWGAA